MLPCGGDLVHFAMTVLKTPSLRLEGFEFPDAEASKAGYASGTEAVFLESGITERDGTWCRPMKEPLIPIK